MIKRYFSNCSGLSSCRTLVKYLQIGSSAIVVYEQYCFFIATRLCFWIPKILKMHFQIEAESFQNLWKHCQLFNLFLINVIQMNKKMVLLICHTATFMNSGKIMFIGKNGENGFRTRINGSSRWEVFYKKVVFKNFAKLPGKHPYQSLFFSLFFSLYQSLKPATLLKKRLWRSCFPLNFAKF